MEVSAFWHEDGRILLYDDSDQEWLIRLAGPLASTLDRADVTKDLRLALTGLRGNATPDEEQQREALAALDIDADEFNEVRQACSGDLSWIVDRILPALLLIDSTFDSTRLERCTFSRRSPNPCRFGHSWGTFVRVAKHFLRMRSYGFKQVFQAARAASLWSF